MRSHDEMGEQSRKGFRKMAIILLAFVVVMLFRTAVMERTIIYGNSMSPGFEAGDVCMTRKYDIEIHRYDVVVVRIGRQNLIKRVIGMPGETLQVIGGRLCVNGNPVVEKFDFPITEPGLLKEPYTVGADEYFLMGDNRDASFDSRNFGSADIGNIKGVVVSRIYPFSKMEIYSR